MPINVTVPQLKDWARSEIPTDDDVEITAAIDAAEGWVFSHCGRRIVPAGVASARSFVPADSSVLFVDDCTAVAVVSNNGTTVSASAYQLEPLNGLLASGASVPFTRIRLLSTSWDWGSYPGQATAMITATWGWPSVPPAVVEATKILAKDILSQRDVRFGLAAITADGIGVSARANSLVTSLLAPWRRGDRFGIA